MSINLSEKHIPSSPGVYLFRDRHGLVLYIGKAANLKNRTRSYFSGQKDPRISKMLEIAEGIDWQETGSEIEALILESQLIKKCRPPFNVMFRDDKQYFYIGFTRSARNSTEAHSKSSGQANEQFPKILISHQPTTIYRNIEVEVWVGPFTDGNALKTTLHLLRRIFPYCTCKQKHNNYCLNYHIGNCLGFCCLNPVRGRSTLRALAASNGVKKETMAKQATIYKKNITAIKEILSGKKKSLIKRFEKELNAIARKEKFEQAIELRDKIEKLKNVFENAWIIRGMDQKEIDKVGVLTELKETFHLPVPPKRIEGYDVSNMQGKFATGAMVVFTRSARASTELSRMSSGQADFQPDKNEYRKFKIRTTGGDTGMLQEIMTRRFNHPEWPYPNLILIDGGRGQLNAAIAAIPNKIPIIALTKNIEHKGSHIYTSNKKTAVSLKKLPPAARNLILQIDSEAHRFAIEYYRKLHRKNF